MNEGLKKFLIGYATGAVAAFLLVVAIIIQL